MLHKNSPLTPTAELSPAQAQVMGFISGIDPDDLHEVATAALFLLADSDMADGKRWIMVRLVEHIHLLSREKNVIFAQQ